MIRVRQPPLALLPFLVAIVYQPAWTGGFVWDDLAHVAPPGLDSVAGLWRIWTDLGATQQYYPLTHSVFWLLHQLFGGSVVGYHIVSILLHATSALLIFLLLRSLSVPGALLAALLFAVHPLHVESVAWISELKNTLSTVLYLTSALLYLRFDSARSRRSYYGAIGVFVLALLSKTVVATLPVALLIVFWWKRGSLTFRRDVVPLIPFFVLGIASGLLTAWVERHYIGAQGAEFDLNVVERVLLAGRAVWFYLSKLLVPYPLVFVYPRWYVSASVWWQYAFPLALLALLVGSWLVRGRSRTPLAVALLFCAALFPALGFVDVFPFRYSFVADHFAYLASIPVLAAIAALLSRVQPWSYAVPIVLAALTWSQSREYRSAETLYRATLDKNPGAWMAHNNLARVLAENGRTQEARYHFTEALRLNPDVAEHHLNVGLVLLSEDSIAAALTHLQRAVTIEPRNPNAHSNLGVALLRSGRDEEALARFEETLRLAPGHPQAEQNLAATHQSIGIRNAQAGNVEAAVIHFEAAVRQRPRDAMLRYNLGTAYLVLGRNADARAELEEALRLRPDFPEAQANLEAAAGR